MAKLGEICAFQSGGTPSKNKPEYFGGEIPWISTTALNGGKINEADAVAWITPKAIRESAAKIVPANSIMIGTRVGIGKVAINTVEMSTSQDVISLINIDEDKWYKPYLCKLLLSKKDYFNSQARGATIKGIKIDVVANIDVPEIDYATQRKVAATLNKIDTLIVLRKQQLEKLDELVKARFVEMFGDPVVNSKRWPVETIENHIDLLTGFPFDSSGYVSKGVNICGGLIIMPQKIDWSACKHWPQITGYEDYILRPNDIVIALDRPWISNGFKIAMVDREHLPALLIQRTARIRAVDINQHYLMQSLLLGRFDKHCNITGSLVPHISPKDIKSYSVMIPPIELQNQFATFVERVDQQKQTVQQSLEKLELMKKALMQEYFG